MEIELQILEIPTGGKILKHEFHKYDPATEFTEDKNLLYLKEDLLQIEFESLNLIVDLGWYGEISKNSGSFKIYVIQNHDWENPLRTKSSTSQKSVTSKLIEVLEEIKASI